MTQPYQFGDTVQQGKTFETRQLEQDTRIQQKINAAHRVAFADKYPGSIEHCLRLTVERLQAGLDKRSGADPSDPETWRLTSGQIADLAEAVYHLHQKIGRAHV